MKKLKHKLGQKKTKYLFVALFVLIGFVTLFYALAAQSVAFLESEAGTRTAEVSTGLDATASGGQYIQFGDEDTTPPPVSNCALPKFPTPSCTGAPAGTQLTTVNGDFTITSPGVYENRLVKGQVNICANNVTFRKSIVEGGISSFAINTRDYPCNGQLRSGVLIEDVTVRPTNFSFPSSNWAGHLASSTPATYNDWPEIALGPSGYTCRRCLLMAMDGPRVASALYGTDTTSANILIEDSYIFTRSNAAQEPCNHTDGVQGYGGGTNAVIRHTTIDAGKPCASGGVFMGDFSKSIEVYDSLLMGAGIAIKMGNDPGLVADYKFSNVKVVHNSYQYAASNCADGSIVHVKLWQNVSEVTVDPNYNVLSTVRNIASCGS